MSEDKRDIVLNQDRLLALENALKRARTFGFSSLSSPVDLLLEAAIDLMLLLKNMFLMGAKARKNNAELRFLYEVPDSLGNPKQIRLRKPSRFYFSPELSQFFEQLACFFVSVKDQTSFQNNFMSFWKKGVISTPPEKPPKPTKKLQKKRKRAAHCANHFYYRRRRKKRQVKTYS